MKKRLVIAPLILFSVLLTTVVSAHDLYYDNHDHFDTDSLDKYFYDYDNYYKYYYPERVYYSYYDDGYYYRDYDRNYRYRVAVFTPPLPRSYGHGIQTVNFRLDHYRNDRKHYRNYYYDYYY